MGINVNKTQGRGASRAWRTTDAFLRSGGEMFLNPYRIRKGSMGLIFSVDIVASCVIFPEEGMTTSSSILAML